MNSPSPPGPAPSDVSPPSPPGVPSAQSGRGAGPALAGFLCALVSVVASLVALVLVGDEITLSGNLPLLWRLGPALRRLHSAVVPGATSGEGMLLFTAAFLVALVGFSLSLGGRRSPSRRPLAVSGMLLSSLVIVCFFLILVVLYISWSQTFRYGALPGDDLWRDWATLQRKPTG